MNPLHNVEVLDVIPLHQRYLEQALLNEEQVSV